MKRLKNLKLYMLATGLLSILFLNSCLKDEDTPYLPQATLRVVNAYTHSPALYYTADNNVMISPANPLLFKSYNAGLISLYTGNRRIRTMDISNNVVSDTVYNFRDSTYYSSFVYGDAENASHLITTDVPLSNLDSKSAIRFFHLAQNTAKVNVYLNNVETPLFLNRDFQKNVTTAEAVEYAKFIAQEGGKKNVIVKDAAGTTLIEREYDFLRGYHYSIILIGDKNNEDMPLYLGVVPQ